MGGVKSLSSATGRNQLFLFTDFLYCYFRYGCLPRQYIVGGFYNRTTADRKDILTYRRFCKIMEKLNKMNSVYMLEDKSQFNQFFSPWIHRKWLLSSDCSVKEIADFIKRHGNVIVKPFDAMEGHGIYKIDVNSCHDLEAESKKLVEGKYMVEEILVQHTRMNFGNASVNTIRVNTILDRNNKAHILSCILRAGVGDTVVDNYCSGGVIYPVNIEYGVVSGPGIARAGSNFFIHPNTDTMMLGYKIPNWSILLAETKKAAEKIPEIKLVGWDVAITKDGIALIEGNHNPDYELYEFIGEGKAYKQIKQYL